MLYPLRALVVFALTFSTGCIVNPGARPELGATLQLASQYNHRGMPMNDNGALQTDVTVGLPVKDGATLSFTAFGNIDLSNDTDGWLPDGHGGKTSEADFILAYHQPLNERLDLVVGYHTYVFPNGLEFPFGERGETKELFANLHVLGLPVDPRVELHYDIDEVEDLYARVGASRLFAVDEKLDVVADVSVGFSGEDHSLWAYGVAESGLADLNVSGTLNYQADEHTLLFFTLAGSSILDSDIADWFDIMNATRDGIDSENFWAIVGVNWNY